MWRALPGVLAGGMLPDMRPTRRAFLGALAATAVGLLSAACGVAGTPAPSGPPAATPAPQVAGAPATPAAKAPAAPAAGPLTALLTNSEVVVGRNRFTLALLDSQNQPVTDATTRLEFFQLAGDQATKRGETQATFRSVDSPTKGVYAATTTFAQPGDWAVLVTAQRPDGQVQQARAT